MYKLKVNFKRQFAKQVAEQVIEIYKTTGRIKEWSLTRSLTEVRHQVPIVDKVYVYFYTQQDRLDWVDNPSQMEYVVGFLKALDSVTVQDLQHLKLTSHEQMMLLEEAANV